MTRLVSIKIEPNLPDGLGSLGNVVCDRPPPQLHGWRIMLRGPAVFLVSPPGWMPGLSPNAREKDGPSTVYEIPRISCVARWEGIEGIESVQKHDTPPMWTAEKRAEMAAAEAAELERATAPTTATAKR